MLPIRIRRGLSADRLNYTPANGELIVTTDTKELFVGDGVTAGGFDVTAAVKSVILDAVVSKDSLGVANGVATLDANGKVVTTWSVGALCGMKPDYMPYNKWNLGFAEIEFDKNRDFEVYNKRIINNKVR